MMLSSPRDDRATCSWRASGLPCSCVGSLGDLVQKHGVSLGVTGSPCNPFSTFRTKRFADGSVSAHAMTDTTMASVIQFYQKFEPRAGITEQVKGFGMRTSSEDKTSPLNLFLCLILLPFVLRCYVIVIDS